MDRFNLCSKLNSIYEKSYGCKTWSVTKGDITDIMEKLMIFEKVLHRIYGSIVENGEY